MNFIICLQHTCTGCLINHFFANLKTFNLNELNYKSFQSQFLRIHVQNTHNKKNAEHFYNTE